MKTTIINTKMKVFSTLIILLLTTITLFSQSTCEPPTNLSSSVTDNDVTLIWHSPVVNQFILSSLEQRDITDMQVEVNQDHRTIDRYWINDDTLDVQFTFPCVDASGEAGVVSDGSYIYTSLWNANYFLKYSLDGIFIDTIVIEGAGWIRNMVYCEVDGYIYGTQISQHLDELNILAMDFETLAVVDTIVLPSKGRALGYNTDLDMFYTNDWNTDVWMIDRVSGNIVDTLPLVGTFGSYYGFAYDNWSTEGPYLWGFSQDGSGAILVQLNLPDLTETGFVMDLSSLNPNGSGIAGGLFVQENIVPDKVTLGGIIQNEVIFGLELGDVIPPPPPATLAGYNIYRDGTQLNTTLVIDTIFFDNNLDPGTYLYEVTSVYNDITGVFYCESDPEGPASVEIDNQPLVLGGNVFAGNSKLDKGIATAHSVEEDKIILESTVDINELGYYFFFPFQINDYYVVATPLSSSFYYNDYISTYFGDVYHWEDSPTIHLNNNQYNEDINLLEIIPTNAGSGEILGNVNFEGKYLEVNPATDVLMLLLNSNNQCVEFDYTDTLGEFEFRDLENGTYKLLCEIIGKKMSPKSFTIDNNHNSYNGVSLLIKDDEILLGIEDQYPANVTFIGEIYPNPVSYFANIKVVAIDKESVLISLFDLSGKLINTKNQILNVGLNEISINTIGIANGLKLVNLKFCNNESINRKFIIK